MNMNHDKIDQLLMECGCRFEFLHIIHYDYFSPYKFAELIIRDCANYAFSDDQERDNMLNHFGINK